MKSFEIKDLSQNCPKLCEDNISQSIANTFTQNNSVPKEPCDRKIFIHAITIYDIESKVLSMWLYVSKVFSFNQKWQTKLLKSLDKSLKFCVSYNSDDF